MEREAVTLNLGAFDVFFGRFMEELNGKPCQELFLASCLASSHLTEGHICVDLTKYVGKSIAFLNSGEAFACPPLDEWIHALSQSPVVGQPFEYRPLILDGHRFYLYRYWRYERLLADSIIRRAGEEVYGLDLSRLQRGISSLISDFPGDEINWHKVAIFLALTRKISFVSGGPGTGKTYLTARIVALLLEMASPKPLNIALAAPTGKAANRLQESIREVRISSPYLEMPTETYTIHRLLKMRSHSPVSPYTPDNPLPYDVVIVDEASMIDLPLFSRLLQALSDEARIVLLGDKDQLASVEAGAVFGDLCSVAEEGGYSKDFALKCEQVTGQQIPIARERKSLSDSIVVLKRNFRFSTDSAIHEAAEAVKAGDSSRLVNVLQDGGSEVEWKEWETSLQLASLIEETVTAGYSPYLKENKIEDAFQAFNQFRVLCAIREGPFGVENVNRLIEYILAKKGLIIPRQPWYEGMPVMITKNDYGLMLMNGDCGLIMKERGKTYLSAFFPDDRGGYKSFFPENLPAYETVFAMTVHKSQGSEFDRVLLILPDRPSPILTKELFYTAITRARRKITIIGTKDILLYALEHRTERLSGLSNLLYR